MECKYNGDKQELYEDVELIDTLWNVNRQLKSRVRDSNIELIDTLWNVNRELEQILGKWKPELIDTLWNVNVENIDLYYIDPGGINRYIMECKFGCCKHD